MKLSINRLYRLLAIMLVSASAGWLLVAGCSSSSGPGTTTEAVTLDPATFKNIPLAAGVPTTTTFTHTITQDITATGDITIDFAKTLEGVTLSQNMVQNRGSRFETLWMLARAMIRDAYAADAMDVTLHLSFAGDNDVCNSPFKLGPYTIMGAIGEAVTTDTSDIELPANIQNIVNAGTFEVCLKSTPSITGYLTISEVAVKYAPCDASAEFVGIWTGTYECRDYSGTLVEGPDAPITLFITQAPDGSYTYTDRDPTDPNNIQTATYSGNVCGKKYRFSGGADDDSYDESGTMTITGDTATKTSHYIGTGGGAGYCQDQLERSNILTPL